VTQRIADAFVGAVDPEHMELIIDWGARGGLHTTTGLMWHFGIGYAGDGVNFDTGIFDKHAKEWTNR